MWRYSGSVGTRTLVAVAVAAAAASVAIGCGGKGDSPKGAVDGATTGKADDTVAATATGPEEVACDIPRFEDRFVGFSVGRPDGFTVDAVGGAVVVKRDAGGTELALVYPVVTGEDGSADALFDSYTRVLSATAAADGGGLEFKRDAGAGDAVAAAIDGTFAGETVKGRARVSTDGRQTVFSAYWAPESSFASEEKTLASIVGCYRREAGVMLARTNGQYFSAAIPPGWSIANETQNGIDIASPGGEATVGYAYVTNIPGASTPDGFRDYLLQSLAVQDVSYDAEQDLGSVADDLGTAWTVKATELTATVAGVPVKGVITVAVGNTAYGSSGAISSFRSARASEWERYAAAMAAVQESIVITSTGSPGAGASLPANRPADDPITGSHEYRNEVQDRLSQDWQEAIMGFDNVESPTTGEQFQAPLNSYDPTGPEGPGYYRPLPGGDSELLTPTSP